MTGPVPKKKEARRRRNAETTPTETINLDEVLAGEVEVPVTPEDWHPTAQMMFDSLKSSGQAIWYEPSDWATAYMLCDVLDRWMKPQDVKVGEYRPGAQEGGEVEYHFEGKLIPMPGATLNSILKGLTALMATEGDRRRLKIELERRAAVDAAIQGDGNVVPISQKRMQRFKTTREA